MQSADAAKVVMKVVVVAKPAAANVPAIFSRPVIMGNYKIAVNKIVMAKMKNRSIFR